MPGYGIAAGQDELLPWSWAQQRLEQAHNYWVATAGTDGTPHLAVVWGVWLDNCFYFSTGNESVKQRNLQARPECSVAPESGAESVVVRGTAQPADDLRAPTAAFREKYHSGFPDGLWRVRPKTVIAVVEETFTRTATRWTFDD